MGPFNIVPIMAYIYVFDCTLDYEKEENFLKLKLLRSEALKIFNTYHKAGSDSQTAKPKLYFIANKFPFYIRAKQERLRIDFYDKNSYFRKRNATLWGKH